MFYIIIIGYLFVTVIFSVTQPSVPRTLIYLTVYAILPVAFALWVRVHRLRCKRREARGED